jgi:hypothetical protein
MNLADLGSKNMGRFRFFNFKSRNEVILMLHEILVTSRLTN